MADVRELLIRATGDSRDAEQSLNAVARKIVETGRLKANASVTITGYAEAQAKLATLDASLVALGAQKVKPEVQIEVDRARARLAILRSELQRLFQAPAAERDSLAIGKALAAIGREAGTVGSLLSRAEGPTSGLNSQFSGMLGAVKQLNPVMQGLGLVLFTALIPGFLALVGAIGSAVVAIGAFAAAAAAVAGPVLVGVVAVFARLKAVMEARQLRQAAMNAETRKGAQADKQAQENAEALRNANNAVRAADQARTTAQRQLAQAQTDAQAAITKAQADSEAAAHDLERATVDAYRAMRDAALDVRDAVLSLREAQLGIQDAKLATREAERDLRNFGRQAGLTGRQIDDLFKRFEDVNFNPAGLTSIIRSARQAGTFGDSASADDFEKKVLAVAHARLNEQEATQRVKHATNDLTDARKTEAKFASQGIAAYEPYVDAQKRAAEASANLAKLERQGIRNAPGVVSAREAVRNAEQRYQEALHDRVATMKQAATADAQATGPLAIYEKARSKLSGAENRLLDKIVELGPKLRRAVQGATDGFINGVTDFLTKIEGAIPRVAGLIKRLADAFGRNLSDFASDLTTDPKWAEAFNVFGDAAVRVSKVLGGPVFRDFFAIIRNVALAVMPLFLRAVDGVAKAFEGWRKGTNDTGKLRGFLTPIIRVAGQLFRLIGAIGDVFLAFIGDSTKGSGDLLQFLIDGAHAFADFLRSARGSDAVKKFFADTLPAVKSVVTFIGLLGLAFLQALQFIAPAIKFVVDGFNLLLRIVNVVLFLLNKIPAPIRGLLGIFFPFGSVIRAAFAPFRLLGRVPGLFRGIAGAVRGLRPVFGAVFEVVGGILRGFSGLVRRIFDRIPGFVRAAARAIRTVWGGVTSFLGARINTALGVVRAAFNLLIDAVNFLIGALNKIHIDKKLPFGIGHVKIGFDLPTIPHLASGGVVGSDTLARIGEAGREAVLPLTDSVLRRLGQSIAAASTPRRLTAAPAAGGAAGGRGGQTIHVDRVVLPPSPSAPVQDARTQAVKFAQELARRGA